MAKITQKWPILGKSQKIIWIRGYRLPLVLVSWLTSRKRYYMIFLGRWCFHFSQNQFWNPVTRESLDSQTGPGREGREVASVKSMQHIDAQCLDVTVLAAFSYLTIGLQISPHSRAQLSVNMASISLQVAVLISQFRLKHQLKTMKSRESILSLFRMLDRDNNGEVLFLTETME